MTLSIHDNRFELEINGKMVEFSPVEESPCRHACPAGIDAKRYVGQIANGDFEGALATIRKHMPFPSVCGRICIHPCETECTRAEIDKPIAIMHLKRFASDYESQKGLTAPLPVPAPSTGKRVAIIGSGPSGLTASHDLALMGHAVTVFEKSGKSGGMLTHAIPNFELPEKAVRRDIDRIEKLGVEIKLNSAIDGVSGIDKLLESGFDAVLIATGASDKWRGLNGSGWIDGLGLRGIQGATEFMISHRACKPEDIHKETCRPAIIGYGVQALACARSAVRLGGANVIWVLPFDKSELQPDSRLVRQTEEEGVKIIERTRVIGIEGDEKVTGLRCLDVELSEPDHTGRRRWRSIPGTEKIIACDSVIDAMYFAPETEWDTLSSKPFGTIPVDLDTMTTGKPGVFAAGDVATGIKSAVEAVALGHRAAAGINSYLANDSSEIGTLSSPIRVQGWGILDPSRIPSKAFRPAVRPPDQRTKDNEEVELPYTAWEAMHEARRCLLCGPCEECAVCISNCTRKRASAEDESGNQLMVRLPLELAQSFYRDPKLAEAVGVNLLTAVVDPVRCRACGVCEEICGYHAPRVGPMSNGLFAASIDILACKGCGTCVAACPSGAIDQGFTSLHAVKIAVRGGVK